ncbi:MarR family winged helix-turn-helix transcriptional regulator [Curtobacterium ammoniigenes]|uniref:MarR family winged helix-turn-helix transcriptional regulator n=1 Tax=Curtobacterium ammoniigenes TaxID=395387 RepID=UPI0008320333|nr:MarR family transcriptional regulator [Curtobacterium ammoniigenes]
MGTDAAAPLIPQGAESGLLAAAAGAALGFLQQSMSDGLHQLRLPQLRAVTALVTFGPATPTELAARIDRSVETTQKIVTQLVRTGHAVRTPHPEDHRRSILSATPASASLVVEIAETRRRALVQVTATLAPEDRTALQRLFTLLAQRPDNAAEFSDAELTWFGPAPRPSSPSTARTDARRES